MLDRELPHADWRQIRGSIVRRGGWGAGAVAQTFTISSFTSTPSRCSFTGKYYCLKCFRGDARADKTVLVPAQVLHNADFSPMPVGSTIATAEFEAAT